MDIDYIFDIDGIRNPSILLIESILLSCFDDFKKNNIVNTFESYKRKLASTDLQYIFNRYPVTEDILATNKQKIATLTSIISQRFSKDITILHKGKLVDKSCSKIKNIEIGAGDFHKGMSTAFVYVGNPQKVVFKPTKAGITEAFFNFLDWANQYYLLGDYRYQVAEGKNYHWLEFVDHIPCQSEEELKLYYRRAGFILGILYLLNSVDFHYENVIAKGTTPVLIDHETIIQPKIREEYLNLFKYYLPEYIKDSVIATMLLPNHYESFITMPVGTCGYGYHKQTSIQTFKKEAIDHYTDNWRFITRFVEESLQKQNIPTLKGEAIYPVNYSEELISGFEQSYKLFLEHHKFLLEDKLSPIHAFANTTIRFIWRSTNIYTKIHNQMKLPKNLVDHQHYRQKIHDYLAFAFKNVSKDSDLMLIHKHEINQMLKGDIPFFEVNSSSKDLETEYGLIKDFFEYSAVENIQRKLKKLSFQDLEVQKNLIKKSLLS